MNNEKFSLKGYFQGLKSILTRNAILILLINPINQYGNNMKNAFRTMIGKDEMGLTATVIGFSVSVFLFAGLIMRAPGGKIVDSMRSKLKYILAGLIAAKCVVWLGFLLPLNTFGWYVLFALDGIIWSVIGIALPAILAISVDRRVMGSSLALQTFLSQLIGSTSRPLGIKLYQSQGKVAALAVAIGTGLVAALLCLFLDSSKLVTSDSGKKRENRGGSVSGILWRMVPLCLASGMLTVCTNLESNFNQSHWAELGLSTEYTNTILLLGTVRSVINMFIGVLCDIISPSLLAIISMAGFVAVPFLWGHAADAKGIAIAYGIQYCLGFYATCIKLQGQKSITRDEQGAFSATSLLLNDFFSVIANVILGYALDNFGYVSTTNVITIWNLIALVIFILMEIFILAPSRRKLAAEEETKTTQS